jgi:hypothetical protein
VKTKHLEALALAVITVALLLSVAFHVWTGPEPDPFGAWVAPQDRDFFDRYFFTPAELMEANPGGDIPRTD